MAILKRNLKAVTPVPTLDDDGDEIDTPIEGGVDFSQVAIELSERDVEEYRFMSYDLGNTGDQPHPKQVPVGTLLAGVQCTQNTGHDGKIEAFYRGRIRSPLTAIRAFCVLSHAGPKVANNCSNAACPLWPFKNGKNAYFGRSRK